MLYHYPRWLPKRRESQVAAALATLGLILIVWYARSRSGESFKRSSKTAAKRELQKAAIEVTTTRDTYREKQLTAQDLLLLPSKWDSHSKMSDTTVILNHFLRDSLHLQLDALMFSSAQPKEVWVCLFNSPGEELYKDIVQEYVDMGAFNGGLKFVASDYNFKYYGRFQLALQAKTKYVWIVDDDVIPGLRYLELLTHAINTDSAHGMLGSVGWLMPQQPAAIDKSSSSYHGRPGQVLQPYKTTYSHASTRGGLYFPDEKYSIGNPYLMPADLLCSQWFLETDWIKLLFREKWVSHETAEDFMLSYSLRRYGGIQSFVMPADPHGSLFSGNVDHGENGRPSLSSTHRTTVGSVVEKRQHLWQILVGRGGEFFWEPEISPANLVLLLIRGPEEAAQLGKIYRALGSSSSPYRVFIAFVSEEAAPAPLGAEVGLGLPRDGFTQREDVPPTEECIGIARALGLLEPDEGSLDDVALEAELGIDKWRENMQHEGRERWGFNSYLRILKALGLYKERGALALQARRFCYGDHWGVFKLRVGQDYTQKLVGPLPAQVELTRALTLISEQVSPSAVMWIGGGAADATKQALEAAAKHTVTASAGKMKGFSLPPNREGAWAAAALAFLPSDGISYWKVPKVTVLLLYPQGATLQQLERSLQSLSAMPTAGDTVAVRLLLPRGFKASDIRDSAAGLLLRTSFYSPSLVDQGEGAIMLESMRLLSDDDYVMPILVGQPLSQGLYMWLKYALVWNICAPAAAVVEDEDMDEEIGDDEDKDHLPSGRPGRWLALSLPQQAGHEPIWLYGRQVWVGLQAACGVRGECSVAGSPAAAAAGLELLGSRQVTPYQLYAEIGGEAWPDVEVWQGHSLPSELGNAGIAMPGMVR